MDVAAYLEGRLEFEQHRLVHEDVAGLDTETLYFILGEIDLLARFASAHFEQFVDDAVNVNVEFVGLHFLIICQYGN